MEHMTKTLQEVFRDGLIAMVITVMVLEKKVPHGEDLNALRRVLLFFLSFFYLVVYWNHHLRLPHTITRVNSKILWAMLTEKIHCWSWLWSVIGKASLRTFFFASPSFSLS